MVEGKFAFGIGMTDGFFVEGAVLFEAEGGEGARGYSAYADNLQVKDFF